MEKTLEELKYAIEHCQMAKKENNKELAGKWADIAHSYLDTALNKEIEVTVTTPITKEEDEELFVKPPRRGVFWNKFKAHFNLGDDVTVNTLSLDLLRQYRNGYQYHSRWGKAPWEVK